MMNREFCGHNVEVSGLNVQVGEDVDPKVYITFKFLDGVLVDNILAIGEFKIKDVIDDSEGEVDCSYSAFFLDMDEDESNELIAGNVDLVKNFASTLLEEALADEV